MLMLDVSTNRVTIGMTIDEKCLGVLVDRWAIRLLCQLPALIRHRKALLQFTSSYNSTCSFKRRIVIVATVVLVRVALVNMGTTTRLWDPISKLLQDKFSEEG